MQTHKKLALSKETLKRLSNASTEAVLGGLTLSCHVTVCHVVCKQDTAGACGATYTCVNTCQGTLQC